MAGKVIDLTGQRFGRLVAIEQRGYRNKAALWFCICDCGASVSVRGSALRHGPTVSCGCRRRETLNSKSRPVALRHGHARKGARYSRTYGSWSAMKDRCDNPGAQDYAVYGGRGIEVCERWRHSFENFLADMGVKPRGKSLDRKNPNGDYTPRNCRWATRLEQAQTKRLSSGRVDDVLRSHEAEAPELIRILRRELLGT